MEFTFKYFENKKLIVVSITGDYQLKSSGENINKIFNAIKGSVFQSILFDFREATISADTLTIYNRPKTLLKLGFSKDKRYAYVYNKITQDLHFLETVMRNNSFEFFVFDNYEKALKWLENNKT